MLFNLVVVVRYVYAVKLALTPSSSGRIDPKSTFVYETFWTIGR